MMKKMSLRKMVLAAAMAAFMVYAPAMAEEDIIIEESFETAEETEAAPEEEVQEIQIEVMGIEAIQTAEVPEEVAQAAEAAETEVNAAEETEEIQTEAAPAEEVQEIQTEAGVKSFTFENEEVIVKAEALEALPENTQMTVTKLEAGSAEYEAAKQAAMAACGTDENAEYSFYDVSFVADGEELELADGSVNVQVEFKTVQADAQQSQNVLHISENGAEDVTAQAAEGENMSSVNFAM